MEKIKKVIREFKLYWRYLVIVLAFFVFPNNTNAETLIYTNTYNWTNSPYDSPSLGTTTTDTVCKWKSSPLMNLTYLKGYKNGVLVNDFDFYRTATDNYDYWLLGYNTIDRIVYDGFASGFHSGIMTCYNFNSYQEMISFLNNISYGGIEIVEPTENYNVDFTQPTPIIFEYRNDDNAFDTVIIGLDYLSIPQFSTETTYNISSTSATSTGVIYSNLMNGSWRVKGMLWNSVNGLSSSSTNYTNFTVSSSTIPSNTWPETGLTDYNLNEIVNQFSTSSIHDTICTTEEWESGDWWTVLSCNASLTVWKSVDKIVGLAKAAMEKAIIGFSVVFPFNLPIGIYNSWVASGNMDLPSGLDLVGDYIDNDGNISVSIPIDFAGQSTSTSIVFFGPAIFRTPTDGAMDKACDLIRNLSTILMLGLFVFGIWGMGKNIYDDLINIKKEDTL